MLFTNSFRGLWTNFTSMRAVSGEDLSCMKIAQAHLKMQLPLHSKFIQAWAVTVLSCPFCSGHTYSHPLSCMEHLLKEVINLCLDQFADLAYYPVHTGTSRATKDREHEHIPRAVQKMGLEKPQHGSV